MREQELPEVEAEQNRLPGTGPGAARSRHEWHMWHMSSLFFVKFLILAVVAAGFISPVGKALAAPPEIITLASDAGSALYLNKWTQLIHREAFKRLGVPLRISNYPLVRRNAMLVAGEIDGDVGRIYQYGVENPNLVRVEEPMFETHFALYAKNAGLNVQSTEELRKSNLIVGYRRGVVFCENLLKDLLRKPANGVTYEQQGLRDLNGGLIDLYCDLEVQVQVVLNLTEFNTVPHIRKMLRVGSQPIYPYLQRKHTELAAKLAAVLKQMKREGLIESYRLQVENELGLMP